MEMAETSWENPTQTQNSTLGLFTFWPKPQRAEKDQSSNDFVEYRMVFEKEGYQKEEKMFQFKVTSEKKIFNYIRPDMIKRIPPVILSKNE